MVVAICYLVYVFDIYEQNTFQVALPSILTDFNVSRLDAGVLILIVGWIGRIAGIVLVPLADRYGRRAVLAWGVLGYSLLTGLTGLTSTWFLFGFATSLTRFPITAANFPSSIMATEASPPSGRALAQGVQAAGYCLGFVLVAIASVVLLPTLGWRYMYFLGIIPAILVYFILRKIPESPRFTEVQQQRAAEGKRPNLLQIYWSTMRRYPREVTTGSLVIGLYYLWNGFAVFVSLYLSTERGLGPATTGTWLAIWFFVAMFATAGGGWLAQRYGRKRTNITLVLLTVPFYATYGLLTEQWALFVVGLLLASLFLAPFGQGIWGSVEELFPTEVRATGFAACNFLAGLLAVGYALIPGIMPSVAASFPIFAAGYAMLAVVLFFMKDTLRKDLIQTVGQRAGDGRLLEPAEA
ncbi:MAG: MFS transporter [Chloroflexi bacterium]|nr:MFS transporter [Chloroflexota bacterium]